MTEQSAMTLSANEMLAGLKTVQSVLAPDLTPEELRLFAMVANRSGLDPFAKQIYAVKRKGRVTFQTGIDGYRSIAARTGMYDGQDEPEYGPVCGCGDGRPVGHPEFATVRVYRKGVTRAIAATAYWHEYKPEGGQSGLGDAMWTRMPRVMIAKVAEALALRKAFPYDPERREGIGADVYTADEMTQADRSPVPEPQPKVTLAERAAERAAAIETPAEPVTEEPPVPAGPYTQAKYDAELGGLTKRQFVDALAAVGISPEYAMQVRTAMYPDISVDLSDAERKALLDSLTEGLQAMSGTERLASEPLFTEGEWAPTETATRA